AAQHRRQLARSASLPFQVIVIACGLLYLLAVGFPWPLNPLTLLLPSAYVVQGVVPLMIAAQILQGVLQPPRAELTGAGQVRTLLRLEVASSLPLCLASATAGVTGAIAAPVGAVLQGV